MPVKLCQFLLTHLLLSLSPTPAPQAITLPLDTAKVRLQLQSSASAATQKYRGMAHTIGVVAREEGLVALWKGFGPGMQRQVLYGGLRIGAYEPVRNAICKLVGQDEKEASLGVKIIAGLLTGAGAIAIASPTDLVKVRMQSQGQVRPQLGGSVDGSVNESVSPLIHTQVLSPSLSFSEWFPRQVPQLPSRLPHHCP